jgi:hypothetical protein
MVSIREVSFSESGKMVRISVVLILKIIHPGALDRYTKNRDGLK